MTMEDEAYHKRCFKCAHGGCPLTHSSYARMNGILYCRHHFAQLFLEKGTFSHVLDAANRKKNALEQVKKAPEQEPEVENKPETTEEADQSEEQES